MRSVRRSRAETVGSGAKSAESSILGTTERHRNIDAGRIRDVAFPSVARLEQKMPRWTQRRIGPAGPGAATIRSRPRRGRGFVVAVLVVVARAAGSGPSRGGLAVLPASRSRIRNRCWLGQRSPLQAYRHQPDPQSSYRRQLHWGQSRRGQPLWPQLGPALIGPRRWLCRHTARPSRPVPPGR